MQPPDNMDFLQIFGLLIGGLALFLFGLELMTTGLKAIAGSRLQALLGTLTANRFRGILAGAGVTALLNSSTITTVLTVGFVSAGLMTLKQSIPMIMGANIGSTLTAQIIAFKLSALTPFMLALGFVMHAFAKRELIRLLGSILLGFGLLFLGIEVMGDSTRPLRTFQPFIDAMQNMRNPFLGIVIGAVFTAVVQSSAATLGIVIALASQGLIPLDAGIALVLGANVGTCGTALLAAIGKPPEALQVGIVHLLFNVLGVLFFAFIIPQFADFVRLVSPSASDLDGVARLAAETPRQVANAHTIFSCASTLVLIWFTRPIGWLAERLAPSRPLPEIEDPGQPRYLDDTLLDMPALGIQRVQLELVRLGSMVRDLVRSHTLVAVSGDAGAIASLTGGDKGVDRLASSILLYIGRLSESEHSEREGRQLIDLAQTVTSLEGINEVAAINFITASQRRLAQGIDIARLGNEVTARFAETVVDNLEAAVRVIGQPDPAISSAIVAAKPQIEEMAASARQSLIASLNLSRNEDVLSFRLASDLIEQFNEIARLSRAVAKSTRNLDRMKGTSSDAAVETAMAGDSAV